MKNYLLPTALLGTIALVSFVAPAVALSPVQVQQTAKQVTVRVTGCDVGSGVIIRKNNNTYTVLTVAHVVRNSGCEIITPDNEKYRVSQVKVFPNNVDLAVVSFTSNKNYPVAKLIDNADRISAGEPIYVSGFPLSGASQPVFTFVRGEVVSNSTTQQGKGYSLIYSHNPLTGSGSPIWNTDGELIAIHGRGDVDTKLQSIMNAKVRVKTGYSLGITVNTFTKLANTAGISGYAPVQITVKPRPVEDLIASALLKERKGDYRGMLADLDRAIFLDSQNAQLYYNRGVAKSMLGNQDALGDYNQAIALNLNEASVYNNRGVTKSDLGDNKGAIVDYDKAILLRRGSANALNANDAKAYYNRGNAKAKLGATKAALKDFNQAIELDPQFPQAYFSRGTIKAMLGDAKGEIADFDRAIALDPNYTEAHYNLGLAKSARGDSQGAIVSFNRAIALNPKDPKTYYDRGNAKAKTGDNQGAIEDYNRAIAIDANNAKAYADRGLVKAKLGDKKGAIIDLKKAANRFKLQRQTASYQRVIAEIQRIGS